MFNNNNSVLITDIYQLTMMQAYFNEGMEALAVFEFFVRPAKQRNFFIAAGLEQVIEYVLNLKFTQDEIDYLASTKLFSERFLKSLADFKFTGAINAMPEGTIFFPNEPILQVVAPIGQAQFIESRVINILQLQTMIASKAIRSVIQAPEKLLIDFGMRRSHGSEAALYASRANYIAGFNGTSLILAGKIYDIPIYGTMAHSYVQAHEHEQAAFLSFAKSYPNNLILLIDTYNMKEAAEKIVVLAKQLSKQDIKIKAVRIDSGDLNEMAIMVRQIFDAHQLNDIKIFASGDLDEFKLKELIEKNAPIDGFGIGTKLDTSADKPYLNCAYKLEEYAGIPRRKYSEGKATYPGKKNVFRFYRDHIMSHDVLALADESINKGDALLKPVIKDGKRIMEKEALDIIRSRVKEQIQKIPTYLKSLEPAKKSYEVKLSEALQNLIKKEEN